MWKVYLKQIWYLLKENKFFSMVYILGTALSITMVMLILMAYHLKTGNIGAEDKRDRMLEITRGYILRTDEQGYYSSAFLNSEMIEKWFYPLKRPEAVTQYGRTAGVIYNERENRYEELTATYADANFWKVFSFHFVDGRGFSKADVSGKVHKVVLDATTARRLFGDTKVAGRSVNLNWKNYKVCGVVEDVPSYLSCASSHLYYPCTTAIQYTYNWGGRGFPLGPMNLQLLMRSSSDRAMVTQELKHQIQLMNQPKGEYMFSLKDQPFTFLERALRNGSDEKIEEIYRKLYIVAGVLVLLMIVPALNLSGLIVARMRKRSEEIGIRKAFGASTGQLMWQMWWENFIQMVLGGILGLLLSAVLFQCVRTALLTDFGTLFYGSSFGGISSVTFWHLVSPVTVGYVLGACFLLNLFSTLLPAWRYTRMSIVEALNRK